MDPDHLPARNLPGIALSAFAPQAALSLGPPGLAGLPPRTLPLWRLSRARQPPGPLVNPNVSAPTTHGPVLANPVTSVPTGRGKFGHRQPHTLGVDRGRDRRDTATNQGTPRIAGGHQELEEARKYPRPETFKGVWPRRQLDLGIWPPEPGKKSCTRPSV